ncbi:MAG: sigma-70 family RNA polymerase sigma factor [Bacteroidota bacterium]
MNTAEKLNPSLWLKNYGKYLYQYAGRRVNDMETVNDLVQETFLSGLEKAYTFEGKCSELTWLRKILNNKIIDHYRRRSSGLNACLELRDYSQQIDEHIADDPDNIAAQEFYVMLDRCLKLLPTLWMTVFKMKHLDEEKAEVICNQLQISPSNYWVIAHRAKIRIREYFRNYD